MSESNNYIFNGIFSRERIFNIPTYEKHEKRGGGVCNVPIKAVHCTWKGLPFHGLKYQTESNSLQMSTTFVEAEVKK